MGEWQFSKDQAENKNKEGKRGVKMEQPNDEDDESMGNVFGQNLVADAITPAPPIRVALIVHFANVIWCLGVVMLGALPYYHYFGAEPSLIGMCIGIGCWLLTFILMSIAIVNQRLSTAIICGALWTMSNAVLAGFLSAMISNIIVLQFFMVSLVQSVAIIVFLQLAPKQTSVLEDNRLNWRWTLPGMLVASVLVWLLWIYAFVVEDDWWFGLGLAVMALALIAYNGRRLSLASDYNTSRADLARAIMEYYCGEPVALYIKSFRL